MVLWYCSMWKLFCSLKATRFNNLYRWYFQRIVNVGFEYHLFEFYYYTSFTGEKNGDCSQQSPNCTSTEEDLLQAVEDLGLIEPRRFKRDTHSYPQEFDSSWRNPSQPFRRPLDSGVHRNPVFSQSVGLTPNRRQSFLSNLPPLIRPEEVKARGTCKTCDARGTVCTVFGVGKEFDDVIFLIIFTFLISRLSFLRWDLQYIQISHY